MTLTITKIPRISFITYTFIDQFFTFASTFMIIPTLLLLQTLASNLHLHLHVSCHFMCLVSLVLDIRLNTLTFKFFYYIRDTYFCIWIIDIITTATTFICFNNKRIKYGFITININNFRS